MMASLVHTDQENSGQLAWNGRLQDLHPRSKGVPSTGSLRGISPFKSINFLSTFSGYPVGCKASRHHILGLKLLVRLPRHCCVSYTNRSGHRSRPIVSIESISHAKAGAAPNRSR